MRHEIERCLAELGIPRRDVYELPTSGKTFPDGAHFRTEELPTTLPEYEKLLAVANRLGYAVNRITDTRGTMFDTDEEIVGKLELASQHGCEVVMGPGAAENPFDISQQAEIHQFVEGKVRGMDNVGYVLEDLLRVSELGCRAFLMYDEGVILLALKMRAEGLLPAETKFKISANISVANPAAVKFWFDLLGPQDEINPARDLTLPMIAALRQVTDHAFDLHTFHRTTVARTMEAPEMVRVGSPLYLKNARFGLGVDLEARTVQGFRVVEALTKAMPEARQSAPGAAGLAVPVRPSAETPATKKPLPVRGGASGWRRRADSNR